MRALSLQEMNAQLDVLSPFLANGSHCQSLTRGRSGVHGIVLETPVACVACLSDLCSNELWKEADGPFKNSFSFPSHILRSMPATAGGGNPTQRVTLAGVPSDHDVFQMTTGGLKRLEPTPVAGGIEYQIADINALAVLLMTSDGPTKLSFDQLLRSRREECSRRTLQLTRLVQNVTAESLNHLGKELGTPRGRSHPWLVHVEQANVTLHHAEKRNNDQAWSDSEQQIALAHHHLDSARQLALDFARNSVGVDLNCPLLTSFAATCRYAYHLGSLSTKPPGLNLLEGGDCEDMQAMLGAGWRIHANTTLPLTLARICPTKGCGGSACLEMQIQAQAADGASSRSFPCTKLSAVTPEISLRVDECVMIQGMVRIIQSSGQPLEGLWIYDSFGGPEHGHHVASADRWQPFALVRCSDGTTPLKVTLELRGVGDVLVDDCSVSVVPFAPQISDVSPSFP
jgi:hypothetical protein